MKSIINIDLISEEERMIIAKNFLTCVEDYFQSEKHQREFEIWMKEKEAIKQP